MIQIPRKRFVLELNSHALSYFQNCEMRYKYSNVDLLVQREEYYPFKRGAGIARYLAIWYLAKKKNYSAEKMKRLEWFLFKRMAASSAFINTKYSEDDRMDIAARVKAYFNKYRTENYPIIAVEEGFSKILFENKDVLFVYSGRPDLVVDFGKFGIGPIDHKTESRESNIAPFNNQFVGYCWALGANFGLVNYIGLQKDFKDDSVLRRKAFSFTNAQIAKWRNDTISWYNRIMKSIVSKNYTRSWNCEGKYGTCLYHNICISGSPKEELIKIKRDFKTSERVYRSW